MQDIALADRIRHGLWAQPMYIATIALHTQYASRILMVYEHDALCLFDAKLPSTRPFADPRDTIHTLRNVPSLPHKAVS